MQDQLSSLWPPLRLPSNLNLMVSVSYLYLVQLVLTRGYNLEPSKNWDDDFELQSENHKIGNMDQRRRQ